MRVRRPEPGPGYRGEVVNSKLYFPSYSMPITLIPKKVVARQHEITADFQRPAADDVAAGPALGRVTLPDEVGPGWFPAAPMSPAGRTPGAVRPWAGTRRGR